MSSLPPQTPVRFGAYPDIQPLRWGPEVLCATRPCLGPAFRTNFAPSRLRDVIHEY